MKAAKPKLAEIAARPVRIQRKRTKGWRMPEDAVYVGRPTKFGNPWTPERYWRAGYSGTTEVASAHCVDAYRAWLLGDEYWLFERLPSGSFPPCLRELRGKDLACWCPLDRPCHADVLLELANL